MEIWAGVKYSLELNYLPLVPHVQLLLSSCRGALPVALSGHILLGWGGHPYRIAPFATDTWDAWPGAGSGGLGLKICVFPSPKLLSLKRDWFKEDSTRLLTPLHGFCCRERTVSFECVSLGVFLKYPVQLLSASVIIKLVQGALGDALQREGGRMWLPWFYILKTAEMQYFPSSTSPCQEWLELHAGITVRRYLDCSSFWLGPSFVLCLNSTFPNGGSWS